MSRNKQYPFLERFKCEYGISMTNKDFDALISLDYRKHKTPRHLFNLLIQYGKAGPGLLCSSKQKGE